MKNQIRFYLVSLLFAMAWLRPMVTLAQNSPQKKPLILALDQLQARFGCRFSYVDKSIANKKTSPLPTGLDLAQSMAWLQKQTGLDFILIDPNTIAISSKIANTHFCGVLLDSDSELPIGNASIRYTNTTTSSDSRGNFSFSTSSFPISVQLSALGYQTKQIALSPSATTCPNISLKPKIEQLQPIVVRNYISKGISQQSDGSFEVDYGNFGILPGLIEPDILQTLQALPGIQSVNKSVSDINIRGGTNDQNLVLWEGIKMYQSGHFFGLISAFNPYITEKATVTKNGSNARYGDGVSGVITLQTSDTIPKTAQTSMGVNMTHADALVDTPIGTQSGLQVALRKSYSEILETPTYERFFDKAFQNSEVANSPHSNLDAEAQFSFFDISVRGLYKPSKKELLKTNFLWIQNTLKFQENGILNGASTFRESTLAQRNLSASLSYKRTWNARSHSHWQYSATSYQLEAVNADIENEQRLIQTNEVIETDLLLDNTLKLSDALALSGGYQFTETGIINIQDVDNPIVRSAIKNVLRKHGVFVTSAYEIPGTAIHLGVRAHYLGKFDRLLFEPRLRISQQFWKHLSLQMAAELKSQTTTQRIDLQNDFLGVENRRWQLSDLDAIPILQSQQFSLGLQYRHQGWLWSAEGYLKKVTGITAQSQGFQNQFQLATNTGDYSVVGGDFLIHKSFANGSAWLSYTLANNRYEFDQLLPAQFPNAIDIRHTLTAGASYTLNNFKISAGINWHSGKPTTLLIKGDEIRDQQLNFDRPNAANLGDFLRIDTSIMHDFEIGKRTKIKTGIALWNVTHKNNTYNSFYQITEGRAQQIDQRALRFTPNVILRLFF